MSFAHFDEIFDICCDMGENAVLPKYDIMKPELPIKDEDLWWERAAKEILHEKEEKLTVV
ncbi:hypothetical protein [Bacillus sp. FJAT-47783]|uniref:hypothetical protein n=1 Tax=Bacillus sp. FJAT-47783 TaxID=2922712 RepID=UPI001FABE38C|nr:hypothetical protein [Bacillus sp. FJAT-47783]